jgi:putative transposase
MRRRAQQLELPAKGRGGRRPGAGRPKSRRPRVPHLTRAAFPARFPVHVTLRVRGDVGSLRTERRFAKIKRAFRYGRDRFGARLAEFSVQSNHIHLIVEANDRRALARGIQGLAIRVAKGVNKAIGRQGKVFADRYHARILRTLAEVKNAVHYVRRNWHKHRGASAHPWLVDPFSSMSGEACWHLEPDDRGELVGTLVVTAPLTWLLTHAAPS